MIHRWCLFKQLPLSLHEILSSTTADAHNYELDCKWTLIYNDVFVQICSCLPTINVSNRLYTIRVTLVVFFKWLFCSQVTLHCVIIPVLTYTDFHFKTMFNHSIVRWRVISTPLAAVGAHILAVHRQRTCHPWRQASHCTPQPVWRA